MPREKKSINIIASDRRGLFARQIRIANSLVNNGYKVKILAWDRTATKSKIENIEGYKIYNFRFKPLVPGKQGLFISYPIWWLYVIVSLLKDNADLYHAENLYSLIPAIFVKSIKKTKIMYDLVDFVADSFNWSGSIRMCFTWLENFCLKFADGVIVVDIRKQQLNMANVKKIVVVTNCPIDMMNKLKSQKAQNEFIIYYGGWLSKTRGLKNICEAIQGIKCVKLVVAGFGPDEVELKSVFAAQSNVEFVGLLSDVESLEWTSRADVIFVFYDPKIKINRLASPAKLYDAMMCGTPVLVNSEAVPVAETVRKEKCGLIVPYGDILGIRKAIKILTKDNDLRDKMGQNARRAFEREYNWTEMEHRLIKFYDGICK